MKKIFIIIIAAIAISVLSTILVTIDFESENIIAPADLQIKQESTVIIQTKDPHAKKILELCNSDKHCYVEALWDLADQESDEVVFATIDEVMSDIQNSGFYCHSQAHHIGGFLYAFTKDLPKALSIADRTCGGAIYHGIVETYFLTEVMFEGADVEKVAIADSCNQLVDASESILYLECIHGIGHGLVKLYEYDVFAAVKRCDEFETLAENSHCQQGVFMANAVEYIETGGGAFDENEILYPCNQLDSKYAATCYYYHTSYLLEQTKSVDKAFEQCDRISDVKQVQGCYLGIGRQIYLFVESNDLNRYCQMGDPKYHSSCFGGAVIVATDQFGLDKGFETCQLYPEKFQMGCYSYMGIWISGLALTDKQIDSECKKAGVLEYYQACLQQSRGN